MKHRSVFTKRIRVAVIVVLLLVIANTIFMGTGWVDTDYASSAHLRFHYIDKAIDTKISDADLRTLKSIFHGFSYREFGTPACGFGSDVSVTLTDGRKSITFYPACDNCDGFRIGNTGRYISVGKEKRKLFEATVMKYGMTFPCE